MPHTKYAVSVYYIIVPAEVSSNLARFDGIRYARTTGNSSGAKSHRPYFKNRGAGFGAESKRRIILGTFVLSSGYYDAYYEKAQRVRTLIKNDFDEAFTDVDVMLTPVAPMRAFKIGEKADDPLSMYLADVFAIPRKARRLPGDLDPHKSRKRACAARAARGLPADRKKMARSRHPRPRPVLRKTIMPAVNPPQAPFAGHRVADGCAGTGRRPEFSCHLFCQRHLASDPERAHLGPLFALIIYIGVKTITSRIRIERFRDIILKSDIPETRTRKPGTGSKCIFIKAAKTI